MKDILKILIFSSIFSVVIFYLNYNFFWNENNKIENNIAEERFIETEVHKHEVEIPTEKRNLINYFAKKEDIKYEFHYHPISYENEIKILETQLVQILNKNIFLEKISNLNTSIIKEKKDRRWKMKNKNISLFWANKDNTNEYISVFIHEFAHYIDLYFLEKKVFLDISDKFYKISWETTKTKKIWQNKNDFVSWYAMTNKYEDFAETFTYYILHNKHFLQKTKNSDILKEKYDFFANYIFKNKEFFATEFSNEDIRDYYRDITKITFNKKEIFNYLDKIKDSL